VNSWYAANHDHAAIDVGADRFKRLAGKIEHMAEHVSRCHRVKQRDLGSLGLKLSARFLAIEIGTKQQPIPTPTRMKPGKRSVKYEPWTEICVR